MAKLTIELDAETHQNLKHLAVKDERSLTQYIQRVLRQHAGTLVVFTTTDTTTDTTEIPEKEHNFNSIIKGDDEVEYWN